MKTRILAAIIAAAASPLVFAQSDDCMSPTPISGGGIYAFDLTTATPSIGIPNGLVPDGTDARPMATAV